MSLTTSQIDDLPSFTPAQMLKAVEYALVMIPVSSQSYSINGRSFNRANFDELVAFRDQLKAEVEASGAEGGRLTSLAVFGEPQ